MWGVLFAVLAAGGAGLLDQAWHAPGSPARAELTYAGDAEVNARLDLAAARLSDISANVERLAEEAKISLEEITNVDPTPLRASLERGGDVAEAIETATRDVRASLANLPGEGEAAPLEFSNATLVRRSAILTALDASSSLAGHWRQVATRAIEIANLTGLINQHDTTVLEAARRGRNSNYAQAVRVLDQAILVVADIQSLRARLIAGSDGTVLDEWIRRNGNYDRTLQALYQALDATGGDVTPTVQAAYRDELAARAQLPPDRRTIVVIVAEVARGGLTQAVIAIEDAHGQIDEALAPPATPSPSPAA
jgi:hypothetical protein